MPIMTAEAHVAFVAAGCDPHCHSCTEPIPVGAEWGLIDNPPIQLSDGTEVRIRSMSCARCVAEGRPIPELEHQNASARLQTALRPPAPLPAPRQTGHGCFFLDDGTMF